MTTDEKRKPGRPRKYAGNRPTWTVRLPEPIGMEVSEKAQLNGRSISEEIEYRVVRYSELEAEKADIIRMSEAFASKVEQTTSSLRSVVRDKQKTIEQTLQERGYKKLELPSGEVAWIESDSQSVPSPSLIQAVLTADQITPRLRLALIELFSSPGQGRSDEG